MFTYGGDILAIPVEAQQDQCRYRYCL